MKLAPERLGAMTAIRHRGRTVLLLGHGDFQGAYLPSGM